MTPATEVAIVGAGPYGLATAAHLRRAGIEPLVLGRPMEFWRRNMPKGMLLRSSPSASSISDPDRQLTLASYYQRRDGAQPPNPVPLEPFIAYADWFRDQLGIQSDARRVTRIESARGRFTVELDDSDPIEVRRVVVAGGIAPFAWWPPVFQELGKPLAVHAVDVHETAPFKGKRIAVIGAGQSALETAALLHEADADVEVVARAPRVLWIPTPSRGLAARIAGVTRAPTEVGPRGISWVAAWPDVFRRLPHAVQAQIGPACLAPMGAYWLPTRLREVPITLGRQVIGAARRNGRVALTLDDGRAREVDHVVLGTGFRVDVRRYDFLAPQLVAALRLVDGAPILDTGLESSVPRLHFVGAPASHTFGPVMRFVVGTAYAAPAVARGVLGLPPLPLSRAW
jgi:NADPH-dependent 2,4-dienoyl-CoA reductase/sulfur reductase-like enzyme